MIKFFCDKCEGRVRDKTDLYWVEISPYFRRHEDNHDSVTVMQICEACVGLLRKYLGLQKK